MSFAALKGGYADNANLLPPKARKFWGVMAASSSLLTFCYLTLAIHVRFALGHWPRPMTEKFETRAYALHEKLLFVVFFFAMSGLVTLWPILVAAVCLKVPGRAASCPALTYVFGWFFFRDRLV